DLASSFPSGTYGLVTSCYLHSPVELPREDILRKAAAAVAPGGTLLIVGHAGFPSWADHQPDVHFPTLQEVLDALALPPDEWTAAASAFMVASPTTAVAPMSRTAVTDVPSVSTLAGQTSRWTNASSATSGSPATRSCRTGDRSVHPAPVRLRVARLTRKPCHVWLRRGSRSSPITSPNQRRCRRCRWPRASAASR